MSRVFTLMVVVIAAAALIVGLNGCGGSSEESVSGIRGAELDAAVFPSAGGGNVKALIAFRGGSETEQSSIIRGQGGKIKKHYNIVDATAVEIPMSAVATLRKNSRVKAVEPNSPVKASAEITAWGLTRINAPIVHAGGNMGAGVKVAVLDTGVDYTHADLDGNWAGGYDFINVDNDPMDDSTSGHGTHCAGIIAAERGNDTGVIGVAPLAQLYGVKVLDASGYGDYSTIIQGLQWCVNNNIQIASMSLGGTVDSQILKDACAAAYTAGVLVVAAAGNSGMGTDTVQFPAKYDSVIAVGSTDSMNLRSSFSSTGPALELAAPGSGIYSTLPGNRVGSMSGTSMACPQIAGVAALVMSAGMTNAYAVRSQLGTAVKDLGTVGRDNYFGYGLTDASLAVTISDLEKAVTPAPPIVEEPEPIAPEMTRDLSCFGISVGATKVKRATNVSFSVQNLGSATETSTVTLYDQNKNILIGSANVTLSSGQSTVINMKWTPTYTSNSLILAAAIAVLEDETVTSNNVTTKSVKVR